MFCFVLFALQLSVCLRWHDYRRDDFPTLKFGVVMADLARHLLREEEEEEEEQKEIEEEQKQQHEKRSKRNGNENKNEEEE